MAEGNDSMAIVRIAASAGAAFIALMAIVPATSEVQAQSAPLQLLPGPDQAKKTTGAAATKKAAIKPIRPSSNKTASRGATNPPTKAAAARKNTRQAAAPSQPPSKAARSNATKTASLVANQRQRQTVTNAQRARDANSVRATRTAAPAPRRIAQPAAPAPAPQVVAQGHDELTPSPDNVMRGTDSISLIAMLPWWRNNNRLQDVQYGSVEAENAVLAAAEVWLAANGKVPTAPGRPRVSDDETFEVADAGEINEIDLAAEPVPPPPAPSFLDSLIALLGSVIAAAAATARSLFV
jgi:aryl carrier-like protein